MGALIRKVPLEPEVTLMPRRRVRGNDGHKKCTLVELASDLLVPGIPAAQLALIEPDFDTGGAQGLGNPFGRPCVQ